MATRVTIIQAGARSALNTNSVRTRSAEKPQPRRLPTVMVRRDGTVVNVIDATGNGQAAQTL